MNIHKAQEALQVHDSNIPGSHFSNVGAAGSIFDDVNFQGATFSNVNLSQAQYANVNLTNVSIKNANLADMKINGVLVTELLSAYKNKNRSGTVLFVKDVLNMQRFYQEVLKLDVEDAQYDHVVLTSPTSRLVIHAIPEHSRSTVKPESPPRPRIEAAIKLIFEVKSIAEARSIASAYGGEVFPSEREWIFQNFQVCDAHDPEGNVIQFWQKQ